MVTGPFPNPHRVPLEGGPPAPTSTKTSAGCPPSFSAQLVEEGVRFDEYGRAQRESRVVWDDLPHASSPEPG